MSDMMNELFSPDNWGTFRSGPLYMQLKRCIENAISDKRLKPKDSLPSEREIAALTDFSRVTVRKAMQELVREGLLTQRHGSGTYVSAQVTRYEQSLSRLTSFTEDMKRRGLATQSIWLSRDVFEPSPEEAIVLGLSPNAQVCRIERLRFADNIPLAIERSTLSSKILPDPTLIEKSLYDVLERDGNRPVRAIQRLAALNVGEEDADLLKVDIGSACLRVERISYLESGQTVEFARSIYRGDAYDFVAELQVSSNSFGSQF